MKYMGSKRAMLRNGLGELLKAEAKSARRVIDLFSGSAAVSWFAAIELGKPVVAYDLQAYAMVMASSVITRTNPLSSEQIADQWLSRAQSTQSRMKGWREASDLASKKISIASQQSRAKTLCSSSIAAKDSLIWSRYGGYYFSPIQALAFDAMLKTLPDNEETRTVCLAAMIVAASQCTASPGHTAQPFKATETAGKYLQEAWSKDPFTYVNQALEKLCPLYAKKTGEAHVSDANSAAKSLKSHDLVFLDPPYSGVHYSRFYHVLETIARGHCGPVSGTGRYPAIDERPSSAYSKKGTSRRAMEELFQILAGRECRTILTFPQDECSNGLSGSILEEIAAPHFKITKKTVKTRFSTMGGNKINRSPRKISDELILVLAPK